MSATTRLADFLDPSQLVKLKGAALHVSRPMEGAYTGIHRSPFQGTSVEFSEYRDYTPGDDLKKLDWKVFGKTDRHYIRKFEAETNLSAWIVIDVSASMDFRYDSETSKFQQASRLAAALAFILLNQGDHVGLVTIDSRIRRKIPPRSRAQHLTAILEELGRGPATRDTDLGPALHLAADEIGRRKLVIVLSDLFDDAAAVNSGLRHLAFMKNEVVVFHLLDRAELDFPFQRVVQLECPETHRRFIVEPQLVRGEYMDNLNDYLAQLKAGCRELAVDYRVVTTDQAPDDVVVGFVAERRR